MISGVDAHWMAALFLALAYILLIVLVFLVRRQVTDMAELRAQFASVERLLRDIAERHYAGGAEAAPGVGSEKADAPAQHGRRNEVAAQERPTDLTSATAGSKAEGRTEWTAPVPPRPTPPPQAVEAKSARQLSQETGLKLVSDYNQLVQDVSRPMIDQFKNRWQPVAMEGTAPESLVRTESGALWVVRAIDVAGRDYHFVLPGEKMFLKWSTMRGGGGVGIRDLLDRFYAIEAGDALRLDRAATVYEEGGRYLPIQTGRLYGV